ncbi:Holliday junction branch migration protein RuvA [Candidatus Omnitrophota bacterium]
MIVKISGKVRQKNANAVVVEVSGISYEVLLPTAVMQRLQDKIAGQSDVSLITYHYLASEPSKSTPVLIGFLSEVEKDFFETFITVSGIGPRAALRALSQPISLIAHAIDDGNTEFLRSLPGIGQQRAREIVAKLQNKVGRFGLIRDDKLQQQEARASGAEQEALAVLLQLQYKKSEAEVMIQRALKGERKIDSTEELLNEVYKQKKHVR